MARSGGKVIRPVFIGEYQHTLDEKGRIIVPSKFREPLGRTFVVTRGLDRCLFVYPMSEWENLETKLKGLPLTRSDARSFVRFFFSGAMECELDKQGRMVVPPLLREYAQLTRDCALIGVSNRVEIWNESTWRAYTDEAAQSFADIAEKLTDLEF